MILSARAIQVCVATGDISIEPFAQNHLKEASYTFHLSTTITTLSPHRETISIPESGYTLLPGAFAVGTLEETLALSDAIACMLSVRGSCAQNGLNALNSDLFVEPKWSGQLSLAITNISDVPIQLVPGMSIVKGVFMRVEQ